MKFIHAADLHIDSPLVGLEAYEGAPVERLREATRAAFRAIVDLAIEEAVDFVILAGDLFDGKWRDMKTGIWTAGQFRRLAAAGDGGGIPVYVIRGNHDAASEVRTGITWPDNVFWFSVRSPDTFLIKHLNVAVHGQGFANREVPEDLSDTYPRAVEGAFNIGVLHTSLTGSAEHATYAPTSPERLARLGYDYWALGHVHRRQIVRESDPVIVFAGNSQGRHVNEEGAKGCMLVTVEDGRVESLDFHATDAVRWFRADVQLDEGDDRAGLLSKVRQEFGRCHAESDGRLAAVRLTVGGRSALHGDFVRHESREEMIAELRNVANEFDGEIWLERVCLETSAAVDRDKLKEGADLLGDLLRDIDRLAADERLLAEAAECLSPLLQKAPGEIERAGIDPQDSETLRRWLRGAEGLLLANLTQNER